MKSIKLLILALLISASTFAQKWSLDKAHSKMTFTITHLLISEVDGIFKDFDGTVTSSKEDFSDAIFDLTANMKSISTNQEMRDEHLQKEDMFNTDKFPTMTFKSTSLKSVGPKKYKMTGNLTLKGITKPVILDLILLGTGVNRGGKKLVGYKASGTINRTDFGVSNMPDSVLSNEVELRASGEFVAQ